MAIWQDSAAPKVLLDGAYLEGVLSVDIISTNSYSADTFSVTLGVASDTAGSFDAWGSIEAGYLEIYSSDMELCLVSGMIDSVSIDVFHGVVRIQGRDLSALLIDTAPDQDFTNQSAEEIVRFIAAKHGLTTLIDPFSSISGRFYASNFTRLSISKFSYLRSEWDVIVQLARECQFDAYVSGRILYFGLPQGLSPTTFLLTTDIVSSARIERMLWTSSAPGVVVSAWNSQDQAAYRQTGNATGSTPKFLFSAANLTPDQVTQASARYSNELLRLRQTIHIEMPWTLRITAHEPIILVGVGAAYDGGYQVETVERRFSSTAGSRQRLMLSKLRS